LNHAATQQIDAGLNRAIVSFATARAVNAALSVAQSAEFSARPLGFGASLGLGQAVRPINDIVGQFAELMLAASVAFGLMKVFTVVGEYIGVVALLSFVAVWWSGLRWQGRVPPTLLTKALLLLVFIRFAVPVVAVGSEAIFQHFFLADYKLAQQGIAGIASVVKDLLSDPQNMSVHLERLNYLTDSWVGLFVKLIVSFLLQTLIVPALLFWLLYQGGLALLDTVSVAPPALNRMVAKTTR